MIIHLDGINEQYVGRDLMILFPNEPTSWIRILSAPKFGEFMFISLDGCVVGRLKATFHTNLFELTVIDSSTGTTHVYNDVVAWVASNVHMVFDHNELKFGFEG
jgi:hypothetical protein